MTSTLDMLDRAALWLSRIGAAGTVAALLAMMVHICADTLGRRLFTSPLAGTLEIVSHYDMTAVAFLALALVQRARGRIKVEIFAKLFPTGMLRWTDLLASALTAGFAVAACQEAIRQTRKSAFVDVIFFDLPIWQSYWIMAFGGILIGFAAVVALLEDLLRPANAKTESRP